MNRLPDSIRSPDLQLSDIPTRFRDWSELIEFAATFRPQDEIPDGCDIRGLCDITDSSEIPDIRAALFIEYRRYNHFGYGPEEQVFTEAKEAIALLRTKLTSEQDGGGKGDQRR